MKFASSRSFLSSQNTCPSSEDLSVPENLLVLYSRTMYLVPSSCIQSLNPHGCGSKISNPVSSFISLITESLKLSPCSICPPGKTNPLVYFVPFSLQQESCFIINEAHICKFYFLCSVHISTCSNTI